MTKRKKAGVLIANNRHALRWSRKIVPILTATFHGACTQKGVICISGSAAGVAVGECYLSVNGSGTGTIITP